MISTGHTVSAQEIYGHDIPYLRQVASDVDQMAEDFSTTEIYSGDRLQKIFRKWIDADNMTDEVKVYDSHRIWICTDHKCIWERAGG